MKITRADVRREIEQRYNELLVDENFRRKNPEKWIKIAEGYLNKNPAPPGAGLSEIHEWTQLDLIAKLSELSQSFQLVAERDPTAHEEFLPYICSILEVAKGILDLVQKQKLSPSSSEPDTLSVSDT